MLPTLLDLGFFKLKSLTILALLGLFFAAFIFWRKGKEEYYNLLELFDVFIGSGLMGVLVGRLVFVISHWSSFSQDWWAAFNIIKVSGNEPLVALVAAAWFLFGAAKKRKWDPFEVLDFWVTAVSLGMIFIYLGFFLDGSYAGQLTTLPWGIIMPGTFEKSHPVQLYFTFFFIFLFRYLVRVEYKYRTFAWYRQGKKTAQSGFLLSMFVIFTSLFYLTMTPVALPSMVIAGYSFDPLVYFLTFCLGLRLLFIRSGRNLSLRKKKSERQRFKK